MALGFSSFEFFFPLSFLPLGFLFAAVIGLLHGRLRAAQESMG